MTVRVDEIRDGAALAALEGEWDELLGDAGTGSVFLRWSWVSNWWRVFGSRFQLALLTARDEENRLVGVAPLMVGPGPGRLSRHLRHLMFLGQQGETLAEHLDFIVRRGSEDEVMPRFCDAVLEGAVPAWDIVFLERVRSDSPHLAHFERALGAAGHPTRRENEQASPYALLPTTWEALLSSRSRNFRRQWNNSVNRLERRGAVTLLIAGRDLPVDDAFATLVALHRARWSAGKGSFRTDAYFEFHRAVSRAFEAEGALLLALLQVGDEVVAARYDFRHGGKIWCFQGGWLPAWERMRVGTVLTGRILAWGIERGDAEYDFLSGEDPYKRRWATGERSLVDLRAYAPTLRSLAYRLAHKLKRPGAR